MSTSGRTRPKKTAEATTTTYAWDGARRLKDVKLNSTVQASFGYDGNGARTSKTAGGQTTSYVNDTRSLTTFLQETKGANILSYVPGLAQHDPAKAGDAKWAYFHADAKDNRVLTNRVGTVTKRWEEVDGRSRDARWIAPSYSMSRKEKRWSACALEAPLSSAQATRNRCWIQKEETRPACVRLSGSSIKLWIRRWRTGTERSTCDSPAVRVSPLPRRRVRGMGDGRRRRRPPDRQFAWRGC